MNRGSSPYRCHPDEAGVASMRPRFMNRGSQADQARIRHDSQGFNEAPIHESGKSAMFKNVLRFHGSLQ